MMHSRTGFDIIIAGAGAAGLTLLWKILDSPVLRDQSILLIDQSFTPTADKTWCFWENIDLPDSCSTFQSWDRLMVRVNGKTYTETLQNYRYYCLRSDDFARSIFQIARQSSQVTFVNALVDDFSTDGEMGIVHTSKGAFKADYIFQSILKPPDFNNLTVDVSLIQHFLGWEIESSRDSFDPALPTFMDFDIPQENGITFMYLLPFSKRKALVEHTVFSKEVLAGEMYERQISDYLTAIYNLKKNDFTIRRKEFGKIPMEDRQYPPWYCKKVLNIGIVGGLPKPSTGYTFNRIQKHSDEIVKALETGTGIPERPFSSYRFRAYDLMMLYLLENETEESVRVFEKLFKKNRFDLVLQFLAEQTNVLQELSIFSKMPYVLFCKSIFKMKHRIFSSA